MEQTGSKRESPPGELERHELTGTKWVWRLGGISPWELARRVFADAMSDEVFGQAAQLSFYFLLAFFPMLIFASSLAGLVLSDNRELASQVLGYLRPSMPYASFVLVKGVLDQVLSGASGVSLGFGILFAIWWASYGMEAVINGLNAAFDVREYRPWWKRRLLAISMTFVLAAGILAVLLLVLWGESIGTWAAGKAGLDWFFAAFWPLVKWLFLLVFVFMTVTLIYLYGPNLRDQPWAATVPGTVVALALWVVGAAAFRLYLNWFFSGYTDMYGSLGAVIALLLWLYLSAGALLVGAEVNSEIRWAARNAGAPEARRSLQEGA